MKKLFRKLRSQRGESFVEILVAILIVAFGCMLVASMYTSSMNLNLSAAKNDKSYYEALSDMEKMPKLPDGTKTPDEIKRTAVLTELDEDGNPTSTEFTSRVYSYGNDDNAAYTRDNPGT